MAQAHGDRLSAVDATFLAQERANSHMHVGAVLIFEGPAPAYADFLTHIRSRLHLVPRYRHKLAAPPSGAPPRAGPPPKAAVPAGGDRPAGVDRRPELQPRVPRPPHGAAGA